jgi:hypothetical protein
MDCLQCGGTYARKSGIYSLVDPYAGNITVEGVSYYQCDNCKDTLYSPEMARIIDSQRNKRIHELLDRFPIGDFIGAAETASMLGISRQALHKNRRINHGFIYQTKFGSITLYLKQSVQQYKRTGDGRFPLQSSRYSPSTAYAKSAFPFVNLAPYEPSYELYQILTKPVRPSVAQSFLRRKEYTHVN